MGGRRGEGRGGSGSERERVVRATLRRTAAGYVVVVVVVIVGCCVRRGEVLPRINFVSRDGTLHLGAPDGVKARLSNFRLNPEREECNIEVSDIASRVCSPSGDPSGQKPMIANRARRSARFTRSLSSLVDCVKLK